MSIREKTFESCKELIDYFLYNPQNPLSGFIFRGESSAKYKLLPSVLRLENLEKIYSLYGRSMASNIEGHNICDQIKVEFSLLRDFFLGSDRHGLYLPHSDRLRNTKFYNFDVVSLTEEKKTWLPNDLHEVAALAQHYGIPTRLIDWSTDFFVALFFAATGAIKKLCKAKMENKEYDKNDHMVIWALNAERLDPISKRLPNVELKIITPPYNGNPNLNSQSGVFSLWEIERPNRADNEFENVDRTPLDELIHSLNITTNSTLLLKLQIPIDTCFELKKILNKMGYNASRLFPGYDGVVKTIQEEGMIDKYFFDPNEYYGDLL